MRQSPDGGDSGLGRNGGESQSEGGSMVERWIRDPFIEPCLFPLSSSEILVTELEGS